MKKTKKDLLISHIATRNCLTWERSGDISGDTIAMIKNIRDTWCKDLKIKFTRDLFSDSILECASDYEVDTDAELLKLGIKFT